MTKEQINSAGDDLLMRRRNSLKIDLSELTKTPQRKDRAKMKLDELYLITETLKSRGKNVSNQAPYLSYGFWELEQPNIKVITPMEQKVEEKAIEPKLQRYAISLAWSEVPEQDMSIIVDKVKEYFYDMDIKEVSCDSYGNGRETEYVIKYEFVGDDKSFKILKYSAQFLLDAISTTDYEKFNIAIYGKKNE